jgi:hypothetical protein
MAEPEYSEADASGSDAEPEGLFRKLKDWVVKDMRHVSEWRKEAKEDYEFYSNHQWSVDDLQKLKDLKRPPLTFNRIAPLVNAVVGSERNNRREVRYIQREQGDAKANEVLTAAGEWFRDECGAEFEESDAFEDNVICGMGWTDTRLDFETEPDGSPQIERMDPLEMGWDCYAVKPNLLDASRMWRAREMSYDDAVDLTGVTDKEKLHAGWLKSLGQDGEPHDQDEADNYTGEQNDLANGGYSAKKCLIVEIRWFEKQTYYRGPDIDNPKETREYDERQFKLLLKQNPDMPGVKQQRKIVRRAFLGAEILGAPDKPMVPAGMFGWECMTGYRDKIKGYFYGVVRAAKDPQRWSNKFFSQVMFLLNSQSKGGIGLERGAFEDDAQGEESWAKSDTVTYFKPGALSGDKPKFIQKPVAQFPAGFFTLFQEAKEEINQVTGLSQEFIGTREVDQAGVLEHQRRQSSLNLLASLFDSLRRYRQRQGRTMLFLIQEHLADGRLIRIVGDDQKKYVPLMKQEGIDKAKAEAMQQMQQQAIPMIQQAVQQGIPPEQAQQQAEQMIAAAIEEKFGSLRPVDGRYDVIVDDSPTSPNEKDRTWAILMQMLPLLKGMVTPEIMMELLALSPLSASLVEKLKGKAEEAANQPKPPTPEEMKMQADMQKHQLDMQGKQADIAAKEQSAQIDLATAQQEAAIEQQSSAIDLFIKQQEANLKMLVANQKAESDMRNLAIKEESNRIAAKRANSQRTSAAKS